ncbi:MAG: hypothetical protein JWM85_1817 [Acidimicrobiaceae bacterium]|nr:hypothetical protein [Acidimicrobiaceae bacterium]
MLDGACLRPMTAQEITALGAVPGFAPPIGLSGATVFADCLVADSPNLVAARSGRPDFASRARPVPG